jgi:hypothetical protein
VKTGKVVTALEDIESEEVESPAISETAYVMEGRKKQGGKSALFLLLR